MDWSWIVTGVVGISAWIGGHLMGAEKARSEYRDKQDAAVAKQALSTSLALADGLIGVVNELSWGGDDDDDLSKYYSRLFSVRWEALKESQEAFRAALTAAEGLLPEQALVPLRELRALRNSIWAAQQIYVNNQPESLFDKALGPVPRGKLEELKVRLRETLYPIATLRDRGVFHQTRRAGRAIKRLLTLRGRENQNLLTNGNDDDSRD